MKVVYAPQAEIDLEQIGDFIADDNPRRAVSFIRDLRTRCDQIGDMPEGAALRDDLVEGVRLVPFKRYVIIYAIVDDQVRVERVLHGSRNYLSGDFI